MSAVYTVVVVNVVVVSLLLYCCYTLLFYSERWRWKSSDSKFSSNYLSLQTVLKQKKKIWDAAPKEGTSSQRVHSRVHTRTGSIFNESSRGNAPSSQLKAAPPQVETHEFTTQNYKYERQLYYFMFKWKKRTHVLLMNILLMNIIILITNYV